MSNFEDFDFRSSPAYITIEHTHEEPSRAFLAAWQNSAIDQRAPAEDRAFQQQSLLEITENALSAHHDGLTRDLLVQGCEVLEYFWFGNDHTPVPAGIKRFRLPHDKEPVLALDPYTPFDTNISSVLHLLHNSGLDRLLDYRRNLYQNQSEYRLNTK